MLEGYTTLGFLAAHTSTVDLQLLVTGVTYRHPGLLAKIVTTLDVLSGGRAVLGLGAAWYEQEHEALGVPFPPVAERFERLEETLQIVRAMFDGTGRRRTTGSTTGWRATVNRPAPVRRPPIMVGGGGRAEDAAAGREVRRRLQHLRQRGRRARGAAAEARRAARPLRPRGTRLRRDRQDDPLVGRPRPVRRAGVRPAHGGFAELGVTEVHVMHLGDRPVEFVQELGRSVVPALRDV